MGRRSTAQDDQGAGDEAGLCGHPVFCFHVCPAPSLIAVLLAAINGLTGIIRCQSFPGPRYVRCRGSATRTLRCSYVIQYGDSIIAGTRAIFVSGVAKSAVVPSMVKEAEAISATVLMPSFIQLTRVGHLDLSEFWVTGLIAERDVQVTKNVLPDHACCSSRESLAGKGRSHLSTRLGSWTL